MRGNRICALHHSLNHIRDHSWTSSVVRKSTDDFHVIDVDSCGKPVGDMSIGASCCLGAVALAFARPPDGKFVFGRIYRPPE